MANTLFINEQGQYKRLTQRVDLIKQRSDIGRGRSVSGFKPLLGGQPVSLALEEAPGIFISIQPFAGLIPEENLDVVESHNSSLIV